MKTTSAALAQHLAGEVTTLATLWKVRRRDGQIFGFTDHDRDIAYDDGSGDGLITYLARSGYARTAIESTADLAVDNLESRPSSMPRASPAKLPSATWLCSLLRRPGASDSGAARVFGRSTYNAVGSDPGSGFEPINVPIALTRP